MKRNSLSYTLVLLCGVAAIALCCSCGKNLPGEKSAEEREKERILQLKKADREYDIKVSVRKDYIGNYYYWNDEVKEKNAALEPYNYQSMSDWFTALLFTPKDRWSWYLSAADYLSSEKGAVSSGDWGVSFVQPTDDFKDYGIYVRHIYPSSPFTKYGVTRGAKLLSFAGFYIGEQIDSEEELTALNNHLYQSPSTFTFRLTDGRDTTFTEKFASVTTNYIISKKIFTSADFPGLKSPVGYFNYLSFKANFKEDVDRAFAEFKAAGVRKMIVDLRYNGGGDAALAQVLSSYLAPAGTAGKELYTTTHNALLTSEGWNETTYIGTSSDKPTGGTDMGIGIDEVYFIIGGSSASASELTINGLKPYWKEKLHLVGRQSYGKPNGMYVLYYPPHSQHKEYDKGDYSALKYVFLPICFYEKNSLGEEIPSTADPGSGFIPEESIPDDIYHDFGVEEANIRACLTHIVTGAYPETAVKSVSGVKSSNGLVCKSLLPKSLTDRNYGLLLKISDKF